jgi:alkyl sulfatase BDS1-like metallo-beta-lactamase superfamily hydrolase
MIEAAEMIKLPKALQSEWGLRGYYGTTNHNVKAAFDQQFGWYDGNPATLHPLPRIDAAKTYVEYTGGADAIVTKAKADFNKGDYRWVVQVLMQVVYADPSNMAAAATDLLGKPSAHRRIARHRSDCDRATR